jgi:ribosome-binding ATPase YchF (GTP1/OBG family)
MMRLSYRNLLTLRHFLRGEVIPFADYQRYGGDRLKLMMDAKLKSETKKYIVNEGDIIEFFVKKK